jgi:hypothetical protein
MNAAADLTDSPAERRKKLELREIFEGAYALIKPFFDPANNWNGQSLQHLAFRILREHYPDLSSDDLYVFLAAAKRVYLERR